MESNDNLILKHKVSILFTEATQNFKTSGTIFGNWCELFQKGLRRKML